MCLDMVCSSSRSLFLRKAELCICVLSLLTLVIFQDQVVQSIVSLTSSLMTNSLTVVHVPKVFSNTLIYVLQKMCM